MRVPSRSVARSLQTPSQVFRPSGVRLKKNHRHEEQLGRLPSPPSPPHFNVVSIGVFWDEIKKEPFQSTRTKK